MMLRNARPERRGTISVRGTLSAALLSGASVTTRGMEPGHTGNVRLRGQKETNPQLTRRGTRDYGLKERKYLTAHSSRWQEVFCAIPAEPYRVGFPSKRLWRSSNGSWIGCINFSAPGHPQFTRNGVSGLRAYGEIEMSAFPVIGVPPEASRIYPEMV